METKPKDYIRIESIGKTLSLCFSFFLSPQEKPLASKHFSRPSIIRPTRKCRRRTEKDRNRAEKDEKGSSILEPVLLPLTKTRKRYRSCVLLVTKRSYHCANFKKIDLCVRCLCTSNMKFIFPKKKSRELLPAAVGLLRNI